MLAVQIVNYRTRPWLERCLATVLADLDDAGVDFEVRLLDNASGEDLSELAATDPRISAATASRNLGFGAGHNLLAAGTDAEILWILNPDVEVTEPRTAARLLHAIAEPGAVAVGPRLTDGDGAPQPYDHGRLAGPRARLALRGGHSYWRATDRPRSVAWVSGAAMMVRRSEFVAVGGFDDALFLFKEEEDLCLRLRGRGGDVRYEPSISVRHAESVVAARIDHLQRSEAYFIAKHCRPGPVQRAAARLHQGLAYVHL